jgi:CRP-like cAMP-binding protein
LRSSLARSLDGDDRIGRRSRTLYDEVRPMVIDSIVMPLLRVPIFAGLRPLQITEIARNAERIGFRPGRVITRAGERGECAYLIVAGDAVRVDDGAAPEAIEPGSLVGEMAMLIDHVYGATVVARSRVQALGILRAALNDQMQDDPALAEHFSRYLTARLHRVARELRQIDDVLARSVGTNPNLPEPTQLPV